MKNIFIIPAILLLTLVSCGTKRVLAEGEVKSDLSARAIIKNHYRNATKFETLTGRIKVDYSNSDDEQGTTVSLRMKKDEVIWLSATLSLVKVMITPDRVTFYNKLDNTYFDGDFRFLNDMLGADLDFDMVQNLLLGQSIFDLNDRDFYASVYENQYQLKPEKQAELFKILLLLEPNNFKMSLQQLAQPEKRRLLNISYRDYQEVEGRVIPNTILLTATDQGEQTRINIEYRNIEFNQRVSFPYSIPDGFKPVEFE
ncbi:DUF4292 domain-containing protein [Robertkochia aurantiaca]|uniref:DUF4292 domain-containing protein n=1 Tax=Robertkochia aurantiaca TaxID=2873700 RepID=UPI001CCDA380|nr:DUF4292 domain-containing protein [Robertkochia sp. 3YJGBD-33]